MHTCQSVSVLLAGPALVACVMVVGWGLMRHLEDGVYDDKCVHQRCYMLLNPQVL